MEHRRERGLRHRIDRMLLDPIFNLASVAVTIAGIVALAAPALFDLSLAERAFLLQLDLVVLSLILLETCLRLIGGQRIRYLKSASFLADVIVLLPLFANGALAAALELDLIGPDQVGAWQTFPGVYLIKGVRALRLLHSVQYFYSQKQLGLAGERMVHSELKARIFAGVATILFFFILAIGLAVAGVTRDLRETQKKNRVQQITLQAASYGALQSMLLFNDTVISVKTFVNGEIQEARNERYPTERIAAYFAYGRDYVQIDGQQGGIRPGESIQVSFKDLNRSGEAVELLILAAGVVVVAALLFSLNFYLNRLVIDPVERATRVLELRLRGEEIERSDVLQTPFTEVTRLINTLDHLYQRLRAPARRQLTPDAGRATRDADFDD